MPDSDQNVNGAHTLEQMIGVPPGTYPSSASLNLLRDWLNAKGIPYHLTENRSEYAIRTAYSTPAYLRAWLKGIRDDVAAVVTHGPGKARSRIQNLTPEQKANFAQAALSSPTDKYIEVDDLNLPEVQPSLAPKTAQSAALIESISKTVALLVNRRIDTTICYIDGVKNDVHSRLEKAELISTQKFREMLSNVNNQLNTQINQTVANSIGELIKSLPATYSQPPVEPELELDLTPNNPSSSFIPPFDQNFYFDPVATNAALAALKLNFNFLLTGPTGCGKTQLPINLCAKLGRGLARINCHGDITTAKFLGDMKARNGETYFEPGILPLAMRNGLVLLCDEIDYMPPHIGAILNPVLERGGKLYIPDTGEFVLPAPGFLVAATANTGGKGDAAGVYTGTEVLNTAFLDRFSIKASMDYLPPDEERKMLENRFPRITELFSEEIKGMIAFAGEVRNAFKRQELSLTFSTRKLIDYFRLRLEANQKQYGALELTILNWLDDDDRALVGAILDRLDFLPKEINAP